MDMLLNYLYELATGLLVGKVVFLSFVVAPIMAQTLDAEAFGKTVRRLFPEYYLLGMGSAAIALASLMGLAVLHGAGYLMIVSMALWAGVLASETYSRSWVTPQSNAIRDQLKQQELHGAVDPGLKKKWDRLHRQSVVLNSLVLLVGLILIWTAARLK
ncbi:DUF4149 domain-containing protein [Nitrospira sp. Nam80]